MKMIKEDTEQLSKQISGIINNFISHQKIISCLPKKTRDFAAAWGKYTQVHTLVFVDQRYSSVNSEQNKRL